MTVHKSKSRSSHDNEDGSVVYGDEKRNSKVKERRAFSAKNLKTYVETYVLDNDGDDDYVGDPD